MIRFVSNVKGVSKSVKEIKIDYIVRLFVLIHIEKENHIRGYLAPGGLRSTYYTVDIVRKDTKPYFFVFRGGGWGHAVGMCQSGAAGMADAGKKYAEILKHYYKGTKIGKIKR